MIFTHKGNGVPSKRLAKCVFGIVLLSVLTSGIAQATPADFYFSAGELEAVIDGSTDPFGGFCGDSDYLANCGIFAVGVTPANTIYTVTGGVSPIPTGDNIWGAIVDHFDFTDTLWVDFHNEYTTPLPPAYPGDPPLPGCSTCWPVSLITTNPNTVGQNYSLDNGWVETGATPMPSSGRFDVYLDGVPAGTMAGKLIVEVGFVRLNPDGSQIGDKAYYSYPFEIGGGVPEPASGGLMLVALAAGAALSRRLRKKA